VALKKRPVAEDKLQDDDQGRHGENDGGLRVHCTGAAAKAGPFGTEAGGQRVEHAGKGLTTKAG
jgi:hypothetical protein